MKTIKLLILTMMTSFLLISCHHPLATVTPITSLPSSTTSSIPYVNNISTQLYWNPYNILAGSNRSYLDTSKCWYSINNGPHLHIPHRISPALGDTSSIKYYNEGFVMGSSNGIGMYDCSCMLYNIPVGTIITMGYAIPTCMQMNETNPLFIKSYDDGVQINVAGTYNYILTDCGGLGAPYGTMNTQTSITFTVQ